MNLIILRFCSVFLRFFLFSRNGTMYTTLSMHMMRARKTNLKCRHINSCTHYYRGARARSLELAIRFPKIPPSQFVQFFFVCFFVWSCVSGERAYTPPPTSSFVVIVVCSCTYDKEFLLAQLAACSWFLLLLLLRIFIICCGRRWCCGCGFGCYCCCSTSNIGTNLLRVSVTREREKDSRCEICMWTTWMRQCWFMCKTLSPSLSVSVFLCLAFVFPLSHFCFSSTGSEWCSIKMPIYSSSTLT